MGFSTLHEGRPTLDYFGREYLSSQNRTSTYRTPECKEAFRANARWEDVTSTCLTEPQQEGIEPDALIAYVWSTPDHFARRIPTPRHANASAFDEATRQDANRQIADRPFSAASLG